MLKEPLKEFISSPRLARFKAGPTGVELEFKEELRDVEKQLHQVEQGKQIEAAPADSVATDFLSEMRRLAEVAPRAVVMETHARLEKLLKESVALQANQTRPMTNMYILTRVALDQRVLTEPEVTIVRELSYLRSRVAHEPDEVITSETALRYAELAAQVAISIHASRGKPVVEGRPL